jgi:adenine phosphoribosyltransferase
VAVDNIEKLKKSIRSIPDFPISGITFCDITTLLKEGDLFAESVDYLYDNFREKDIDTIVGIESRGFIFGAAMAYKLNAGFVPVRKPGKLPGEIFAEEYELEYGADRLEIHKDALSSKNNVLIVDDLLATGGSAMATCNLVEKTGATIQGVAFLIELEFLNGRKLIDNYDIFSLISFEGE